jgi:hypothetical protein
MKGGKGRIDRQAVDAGLLGGLPQRGGGDVGVRFLAMPAQLQPPAEPRVQCEQCVGAGVVEHERRTGDVTGHARAQASVGPGRQKREHRVAQGVLGGIGRLPTDQGLDRRAVQAHRRTSRSSVGTGSRGPDGSSG